MNILITGGTGFLGHYLVNKLWLQNHKIYALVRDPQKCPTGCTAITGDVTKGNLGIDKVPKNLDEIWHGAATINLSKKARQESFALNSGSVFNVIDFARKQKLKRIIHISTAYADTKRNPYEESKWWAEQYLNEASKHPFNPIPVLILKPSILVAEYETGTMPKGIRPGAFYEFVRRLIRIHRRIERMKKRVEKTLHLPPWQFCFRVPGDPDATLNLLPVDIAAKKMVEIAAENDAGVFYITNPSPPILRDLVEWISDVISLTLRIESPSFLFPHERAFISVASDFLPYLRGEPTWQSAIDFPVLVDRYYVQKTIQWLMRQ